MRMAIVTVKEKIILEIKDHLQCKWNLVRLLQRREDMTGGGNIRNAERSGIQIIRLKIVTKLEEVIN